MTPRLFTPPFWNARPAALAAPRPGAPRRRVGAIASAFLAFFALAPLSTPATAQLQITVQGGVFEPMPIGVPQFAGDAGTAREITQVIANNLRLSGYFTPIDARSNPEQTLGADQVPSFAAWQGVGAQALVAGTIIRQGGTITAQVRLYDVSGQREEFGQQFSTSADNARRLAHIISDAVYSKITGAGGFFDSRIVFVDESGPKSRRTKRLAVMDWDGANVRYLTRGNELVLTPRFSPSNQTVAYMSYGTGEPQVYLLNVSTGARELIGQFTNMTFSPRFSGDGSRLLFSMQKDGDANIYVMDVASRQARPLTSGASIDTSPSTSPDGSQIVFESDRGGSQQLYIMDANGGGARRISFGSGRYSTPVWSPDTTMPLIAFTKQEGGSFKIGVMRPDGSGERILSEGFHNEGPTWAPNGRYLMFFRESGGANGGPSIFFVDVTGRVQGRVATPAFASDPAWSPLLK